MFRAGVLELVREDPTAHGIFAAHNRTYRKLRCVVKSVSQSEAYKAMSQGLNPAFVFVIAQAWEYKDERLLRFDNQMYRVMRTYVNGDSIELTAERVDNDV